MDDHGPYEWGNVPYNRFFGCGYIRHICIYHSKQEADKKNPASRQT